MSIISVMGNRPKIGGMYMTPVDNTRQRCMEPSEAITILQEISSVSQRLADNLAQLADQGKNEGGTPNEQDGRTGCRCRRAAQMR